MASVDLVFTRAQDNTLPVRLVFGETDAPPAPAAVTLHGNGTITGLRLRIASRLAVRLHGQGTITGLRMRIASRFDINVSRPTVGGAASHWQNAEQISMPTASRYSQAAPLPVATAAHWQDAARMAGRHSAAWQEAQRLRQGVSGVFEQATRLPTAPARRRFEEAVRLRTETRTRFEQAVRLPGLRSLARFQETYRDRQARVVSAFEQADRLVAAVSSRMGIALRLPHAFSGRYEQALAPPRPGRWVRPPAPMPEPCYLPVLPVRLVFQAPAAPGLPSRLVFVCERHGGGPQPGTVIVPIRRVSIVINAITLHRVDTGAQLRAHGFNASLDFGSWTWSWSASLHHDAEGLLGRDSAGDTAELHTVINGVPLRLRLESIELDERFLPQKRWAVSGQGKSSILGDSRAPILSFGNAVDRTAQQLASDALTINGVGIGWSLDWGIADWLVPAGAWALQGRYIDAINDIAAAAGGYVQPHPTDAVLRVLPRYPVPPWEWGSVTPDFEIPRGAAEVVGTKFVDKPAYNGVYVGGESVGVFGPFKRTGTDGAVLAPQVNHALITHADAHRARGIAEISDTGAQEHVTLSMQVLPETGLVVPGQFVRYVGDRTVMGIVRRTSIDLNRPKLRQTIAIETHVAD